MLAAAIVLVLAGEVGLALAASVEGPGDAASAAEAAAASPCLEPVGLLVW